LKYQIGDKILVLQTDEEGKVVDIINEKMVMIEVRGVKFPAYLDQIDFPYFKMFTAKKPAERKKIFVEDMRKEKQPARKKVADGVFLNFIPVFSKDIFDDDVVERLKIYLINFNEEDYTFKYQLQFNGDVQFEHANTLLSLNDFYLHDILFEDVSDGPLFEFEFSTAKSNPAKAPYYEKVLRIKGKQFYKYIEEMKKLHEASFKVELFLHYPEKAVEEKVDLSPLQQSGFRTYDLSKIRDLLPQPRSVVDLHIDKITDAYRHLTKSEIVKMQMDEFEKYYELAVLHHRPSLIIVHGIGEGKLKQMIHEVLKNRNAVKSFVNRHHPQYGYGATEIFFNV